MTAFIGAPIAIIDEKKDKTLQSLLLTPLTYRKLILEKAIFGFLITFLAALVFLLVTGYVGNVFQIIIMLLLASFFLSLVAVAFGILFSDLENLFAFITPLLLVVLFIEVKSSFNNYYLPLPISKGLYKLMIIRQIPLLEGTLIISLSILFIIFDSFLLFYTVTWINLLFVIVLGYFFYII